MADRVLAALADGLWQGALLALGVTLLLHVFRFNASTRYVVWSGTFLAVVALPIIAGRYTPDVPLPEIPAPQSLAESLSVVSVPSLPSRSEVIVPPLSDKSFELALPEGWSSYVLGAWIFVSLVLLLRLARASVSLRRLKRSSSAAVPEALERLRHWEEACGAGRTASLLVFATGRNSHGGRLERARHFATSRAHGTVDGSRARSSPPPRARSPSPVGRLEQGWRRGS